jgi:hypothetical protein
LIRVPYFFAKTFIQSDKYVPDPREKEKFDPIYGIKDEK